LTKYKILISETAKAQLNRLSTDLKKRVKKALLELENNPYKPRPNADIKKLVGPKRNYYRLRIGKYRAIYIVEDNKVLIAKILPRSSAYHWIE
jgi:mRNA interferase RelE/StbE